MLHPNKNSAIKHEQESYSLSYTDTSFATCTDPLTLATEYCAGEHLLTAIIPTVYQNNTGHSLHGSLFSYTPTQTNTYYDSTQTVGTGGSQHYTAQTNWQYLTFAIDLASGSGERVNWQIAYNNTNGTPDDITSQGSVDGRYDPLHCATWNDCTGFYAHPDDHAWSEWVVTSLSALGTDSSASSLAPATTSYNYQLAKTGTYNPNQGYCYPTANDSDCVGDNWLPSTNYWQDYYNAEYQGFAQVWSTSPAGDLTVDSYSSTEGWYTPWSDYQNFEGGTLREEDRYSGASLTPGNLPLLSITTNSYADSSTACRSTAPLYPACEVILTATSSYEYNQAQHESPVVVTHSYSYDDYSAQYGLVSGYHNLTQDAVTLSTTSGTYATQEYTYTPNNSVVSGWTYYTTNALTSKQLVDSSGHAWQCQSITYDEHAPAGTSTPSAGWPTTSTSYGNCAAQTTPITTSQGYDVYGNLVESVDGVASANSALYSSAGCTLHSAPVIYSGAWSNTHYTDCLTYDSTAQALPLTDTNALAQTTKQGYTSEELPSSLTDVNGKTTSESYSYDGSGNLTTQVSQPGETNGYTTQSISASTCTTTSILPCFEIDSNTSLYNTVKSSTYYDALGRAIETRSPGPGAGDDTIVMTVYNDQLHTSWQSVPFEVTHGTGWLDPNGATDYNGVTPGGSVTYYDALGRVIATQDPAFGIGNDGLACSVTLRGSYTACINYSLGQISGDPNTYATATSVDANNHVSLAASDGLGRTIYTQEFSGTYTIGLYSAVQQTSTQYNVLGEATQITVADLAPQSGQSISSITTSAQYDDLGRLTQLADPDRGTHTYSYDNDGRLLTDVSGTRTIGYAYDLLGRLGCVQNQLPTQSVSGACTSGATKHLVNTYDSTTLGIQGSSDFPVGQLTKSVSYTWYPNGTDVQVAQLYQHDARGRLSGEQMSFPHLPTGWNITTALPSYTAQYQYNDANQPVTTTTSTTPAGQGYTSTQTYDSTSGTLTGLASGSATLATLLYDARAQLDTIAYQTSSGTALMNDQFGYDANLRPTSTSASWQSGSGNSGVAYSQQRSYDAGSNIISLSTSLPAVPGVSGSGGSETQNFCYDEQNHLVWAGNSGTQPAAGNGTCGSGTLSNSLTGASYNSSYVYTHLGQLWQAPLGGGSTQQQYLYCSSSQPHQLTGLYAIGATCSNKSGQVYATSYDAWGNVTSRTTSGTTATLSYDLLDRLSQWYASATNQEQYVYDAAGTRVLRRSTSSTGTTLTIYAFGLEEHVYSGSGTNQSSLYYYSLAGHLIGSLDGGTGATTFYLTDALGSLLTSFSNAPGAAQVKGEQSFTPYGSAQYSAGSINTAKGFTGQYADALTGLDYYGARYYDPVVGVFLAADSVQGNAAGSNPYAYVGGNPETRMDPTGHLEINMGEAGFGADTGTGGGVDLGGWTIDAATTEVQVGEQTLTADPNSSITVQTTNPDGSKSWTTVPEGTAQYEQDLQAISDNYAHPVDQPKVVEQQPTVEEQTTPTEPNNEQLRSVNNKPRPVNNKGVPYPKMVDPRTGVDVPFPDGNLQRVDLELRVDWVSRVNRYDYIQEWYDNGYGDLPLPWEAYDIHHILPREFGGTNDFWNLVPLERGFHNRIVTPWWRAFYP